MARYRSKTHEVAHYIIDRMSKNITDRKSRNEESLDLDIYALGKALWFSDATYFEAHGESLTDLEHLKETNGPMASTINTLVAQLEEDNFIKKLDEAGNYNYPMLQNVCEYESGSLENQEKGVVRTVVSTIVKKLPEKIRECTHGRSWQLAETGEKIPVYALLSDKVEMLDLEGEDEDWFNQMREKHSLKLQS